MPSRILAFALVGSALSIAGPMLGPSDPAAQTTSRRTTPPPQPTPQPTPQPPPRPPSVPEKPQPKDHSATDWSLQRPRMEADRTARIDSLVAACERALECYRQTNDQMSRLGTPQTFQNLGLRFEQLGFDLYLIARHLRALHEERDDSDFLYDVGLHRMAVTYELVDGLERVAKELERLQGTLEQAVLP